ncbi:hypothetical protein [Deinococcus wulumuqiensis]|uniref:Uncharacterized protein n=1 Tax=Deinococcus wulumuqiensis TaxID=980427 RepID=A0AAV4KA33_9DEIO|nr:hypothetical protein [Deinococcus wulumuqiensis]QII22016.1 hypothetical protein G6R31_14160 [Deinococcus wulumuqiensis R12]GGI67234.1 hypothetical protein GCM10008021_29430 [Deinococcus wulumuqiensis]GGI93689.1 hypothetical protein GCM10010914_30420 [Deinococcus wulumuqiensis]
MSCPGSSRDAQHFLTLGSSQAGHFAVYHTQQLEELNAWTERAAVYQPVVAVR